jgi:hypothetical protein
MPRSSSSQISFLLPFGLPPEELSADLARALKTPALATFLAKTSSTQRIPSDPASRLLPHEQWLAGALAGARESGNDFLVHPCHIEIGRSHLSLNDLRQLQLSEEHSRALHALAAPMFTELGVALDYESADSWRLRADDWAGLDCASPDAAAGLDIADWMPQGAPAKKFRKLQNEIQMLWYEHPVNIEREQRGLKPVNAFWPWRGIAAAPSAERKVFMHNCPAWMARLGSGAATPAQIAELGAPAAVVCGDLAAAAIANDWGSWVGALEQLEHAWFAPLLDSLRAGKVKRLRLVRAGREHLSESIITPGSLRKFWRAPSLARLAT